MMSYLHQSLPNRCCFAAIIYVDVLGACFLKKNAAFLPTALLARLARLALLDLLATDILLEKPVLLLFRDDLLLVAVDCPSVLSSFLLRISWLA
mmetsp:Transcript_8525/g.21309  ORF Transcript_8525/g.21309 Transcript_8525/m.21309 type:complete len:94 (-) Transcript_8525:1084-1365(-)